MTLNDFFELLQTIYKTKSINSQQAEELQQMLLKFSPSHSVHMARLRLENDIAYGIITTVDSDAWF